MSGPRHVTLPFDFNEWVTINGDVSLKVQVIAYEVREDGMMAQVLWVESASIKKEWVPVTVLGATRHEQ